MKGKTEYMDRYTYTQAYQESLLAVMIKDHEIITNIKCIIQASFFTEPIMRRIAKCLLQFAADFNATPTKTEFTQYCIGSKGKFSDIEIKRKLKKLFKIKHKNKKYVIQTAIEFAQFNAMKDAIVESADLIDSEQNRSLIQAKISAAMKIGIDARKLGTNIFHDRLTRAVHRELHGLYNSKVSTGLKGLNARTDGGLDKGELGVILAPQKGFKTGTLVNLGFAAMAQGLKVVHYTMEVSEDKTTLRYERRIAGLTKKEVISKYDKLDAALQRLHSIGGMLTVKEFPMRSVTVAQLNAHLDYLESEGFVADMVIVDYIDLLATHTQGDNWQQLGAICAALRAMAQERQVPVWTASQSTRESAKKEIIRKEDIAGSMEKIAIADLVIAVCQTKDERLAETARLFVAANREGSDSGLIYIKIDYDRMRIREIRKYSDAA